MAEATFQAGPLSSRGITPADSFASGIEQGQSMMQRASQMRHQRELEKMQREKLKVEMPAIIAKARADKVSAEAALKARDQMENLRRNGAEASVKANEEYIGALALPDWDEQTRVLSELQAKYGWMANVRDDAGNPIYKGFLDAMDNSTINAATRSRIRQTFLGQMELQGNKSETALQVAQARTETQKQIADERATTQKEIAELKAANKPSPSQQKFDEELGTAAAKYYTGVQEKVSEHRRTLDTISSNRKLLSEGTDQGMGEGAKVAVMQAINSATRLTGAGDLFDTSKPEQMQRNYSDFALAAAARMKSQGQITESERKLLADTVAKFGNSKKAALYIMDYMEGVASREIAKAEWLRAKKGEDGIVGPDGEAQFYEENPLNYFIPASGEPEGESEVDRVLAKYRKPANG